MEKRLTFKAINRMIAREGFTGELVQGNGYLYLIGESFDMAFTTSFPVTRLSHTKMSSLIAHVHDTAKDSARRS